MAFSATWFLLEQEGLLAQACLCNGLTAGVVSLLVLV